MTITHDSIGGPISVPLTGTGIFSSDLSVSPVQITFFGNTTIGLSSQPQTLTLLNNSTQPMTLSSFVAAPSTVAISANTCSSTLAAGSTCAVTLVFTPTAAGAVTGSLTISHTGAGNPQVVLALGTGVTQLQFSPSPVQFGDQQVGTTGTGGGLGISNQGGSPVTVQSISVTGDFQITSDPCPLAPAQFTGFLGCSVPMTFTPTAPGLRTGTIIVVA